MLKKIALAVAVVVALAVPAYWHWSPYLALHSMRSAAKAMDADAFNDHIDFPRLRESLKGQISAVIEGAMAESRSGGSSAEQAGASLGTFIGRAMVERYIEEIVRPETMMRAMTVARLKASGVTGDATSSSEVQPPQWQIERKGFNRVLAMSVEQAAKPEGKREAFVFERSGFATWKLVEIRMPISQ